MNVGNMSTPGISSISAANPVNSCELKRELNNVDIKKFSETVNADKSAVIGDIDNNKYGTGNQNREFYVIVNGKDLL